MKAFIALAILAVIVACVNSEGCRSDDDCKGGLTSCADGHSLTCHNRACYCETQTSGTGGGCVTRDDCPSNANCHSGRGNYHCVDSRCRCFYF